MVVHWVHLESIDSLQMNIGVRLGAFGERLCSPNVPSAQP